MIIIIFRAAACGGIQSCSLESFLARVRPTAVIIPALSLLRLRHILISVSQCVGDALPVLQMR